MSNDKVKIKRIEPEPTSQASAVSKPATTINPGQKRVFTDLAEITTDLYKLLPAALIKNVSIKKDSETTPKDNPTDFITAEHCHFFRTKDSDGKSHTRCMPVANHYHVMTYAVDPNDPDGAPVITGISEPMKLAKKRVNGKLIDVDIPINNYDFHTHDVLYVKSEKIQIRTTNIEAAKHLAYEAMKGSTPAGVVDSSR